MMVRGPAVAGQFYPESKNSLMREVESLIDSDAKKAAAIGVVSPHAGYMYSGAVAGSVLSAITPKRNFVILGPNHTGSGDLFGLDTSRAWRTPLGEVEINRDLAELIKRRSDLVTDDAISHADEHSIEVQLPFLQVLQKDFRFVPICVSCADLKAYRLVGRAIAAAVKDAGIEKDVTIIASSDMTHYEPQEAAAKKDAAAIEAVLKLDDAMLVDRIGSMNITMCGFAPAAIMIAAAKDLGAGSGTLVRYQTSGDTSGDYSSVVGYAGIIIR